MGDPDLSKKRYLSPTDVAGVLGVSAKTVRGWCRDGALSAVRVRARGAWRIPVAVLRDRLALDLSEPT